MDVKKVLEISKRWNCWIKMGWNILLEPQRDKPFTTFDASGLIFNAPKTGRAEAVCTEDEKQPVTEAVQGSPLGDPLWNWAFHYPLLFESTANLWLIRGWARQAATM